MRMTSLKIPKSVSKLPQSRDEEEQDQTVIVWAPFRTDVNKFVYLPSNIRPNNNTDTTILSQQSQNEQFTFSGKQTNYIVLHNTSFARDRLIFVTRADWNDSKTEKDTQKLSKADMPWYEYVIDSTFLKRSLYKAWIDTWR